MTLLRLSTVARVGVRTLTVAGFAAGAWLLSSAAAHAATSTGAMASTAAAVAPAGPTVPVARPLAASALSLLGQVLAPATSNHSGVVARTATHHTGDPAHESARSAVAPVRRTPVPPAASQVARAGQPALSRLFSSVVDLVQPLDGVTHLVSAPVTDLLAFPTDLPTTWVPAGARQVPVPGSGAFAVTPTGAGPACPGAAAGDGAPHVDCSGPAAPDAARPEAAATVRPTAGTAIQALPVRRHAAAGARTVPANPERAPLPAYPDSGTHGISTTASGSQHGAGGYAVVSAPAEPGHPAGTRRLRATEVAVRPLLVDTPTFAPD